MPSRRVLLVPALAALLPLSRPALAQRGRLPTAPPPAPALGPRPERRPLAGPFRPAPPPAEGPDMACAPVPPPVWRLEGFGFYLDPAFSRPDPARLRADDEASAPLRAWLALVQQAVARHRAGEAGAAVCALDTMDGWARNEALLGAFNQEGGYHRIRTLAGASLSLLAIREAPGLVPARVNRVARWLASVAQDARPRYERTSKALISDAVNNGAAWAGLAVAAAGIAVGDTPFLEWGLGKMRAQLAQVDGRGVLPQELRRGAMALHYHLSALAAVAALERLGAANNAPLKDAERAAYARLRGLCLACAKDPARMEALAGVPQADFRLNGAPPLSRAVGLEIASVAMPDPESEEALAPFRPFEDQRLGGAVTGWWKG